MLTKVIMMKRMFVFSFVAFLVCAGFSISFASAKVADTSTKTDSSNFRNIATFSVVAYDPRTGETGVAVQSKFFAVGSVVPWCRAGAGAVATQAFGQTSYGPRGLDLLESGALPQEVLKTLLADDKDSERRQLGIVRGYDIDGSISTSDLSVTYTGAECMDWAGGKTGVTYDGIIYSVQGNILTSPEVVDAMAWGIEQSDDMTGADFIAKLPFKGEYELGKASKKALEIGDFPGRLLRALISGQIAGGDSRGMQSAALKVAQKGAGYGGYNDVKYDLRVDDAVDPFEELSRLLNLARPFALTTEGYNLLYAGELARAIDIFESLTQIEPNNASHHYNLACAYALSNRSDDALTALAIALKLDPTMIPHAKGDPDLTVLHGNSIFENLINQAV